MADLRALVGALGFQDVLTLLNSGNVVFTGPRRSPAGVAGSIEAAISARLGVTSRVTVLTAAAMEEVIAGNELRDSITNPSRFLVAFLREPGSARLLAPLLRRDWGNERLAVGAHAAYLWCPAGILESPLSTEVGRLLGDGHTTRNWSTVTRLGTLLS